MLNLEEYNRMMMSSRSQIVTLDKTGRGSMPSTRLEEKKNEPRPKIGFQQNIDNK